MPNRSLSSSDDFISVQQWLDEHLSDSQSITPHVDELKKVPASKGIYFWFMHPDGYSEIGKNIFLSPIENRHTKKIKDAQYDLVYLGTAGTRDNKNGQNNGHLQQRLKWHIKNNKNESAVLSKTMSTFRRTTASLFANDLILDNTQDLLNKYFEDYFKIYWISYPGSFIEVKDIVNNDEKSLIKSLTPLFNLKNNINKMDINQMTAKIQLRRNEIETTTINRLKRQ